MSERLRVWKCGNPGCGYVMGIEAALSANRTSGLCPGCYEAAVESTGMVNMTEAQLVELDATTLARITTESPREAVVLDHSDPWNDKGATPQSIIKKVMEKAGHDRRLPANKHPIKGSKLNKGLFISDEIDNYQDPKTAMGVKVIQDTLSGRQKRIRHRFQYHAPDDQSARVHSHIRSCLQGAAIELDHLCPVSRELELAIGKLEEAMFWANAAIARSSK